MQVSAPGATMGAARPDSAGYKSSPFLQFIERCLVLGLFLFTGRAFAAGSVRTDAGDVTSQNKLDDEACAKSPEWCSVPMPKRSYFGFTPPSDAARWRRAQAQAARGEHVLLRRALEAFPTPVDFVDGDIQFRFIHRYVDVFLDKEMGFIPLTESPSSRRNGSASYQRHEPFHDPNRAAIVMAGYGAYIIHEPNTHICIILFFKVSFRSYSRFYILLFFPSQASGGLPVPRARGRRRGGASTPTSSRARRWGTTVST